MRWGVRRNGHEATTLALRRRFPVGPDGAEQFGGPVYTDRAGRRTLTDPLRVTQCAPQSHSRETLASDERANLVASIPSHSSSALMPSVLIAASVASAPSPAQALTCAPPTGGMAVGQDVLVTCFYCSIDDPAAGEIRLYDDATGERSTSYAIEEVARAALVDGGVARRYRAAASLPEGTYVAGADSTQVRVTAVADLGPPELPTVRLVGFQMFEGLSGPVRSAHFELRGTNGLLVVDDGDPDDDPMHNVEHAWRSADVETFSFSFGNDVCYSSFPGADYGVQTRARFGTLAPNGDFSGWTEWLDVRYPATEGHYEVDEAGALFSVNPETGERTLVAEAPTSAPPVIETAPDESAPSTDPAPDEPTDPSPVVTERPPVEHDLPAPDGANSVDDASAPTPGNPEGGVSNGVPNGSAVEGRGDDVTRVPVDGASQNQSSSACALSRGEHRSGGVVAWALLGLAIAFRRKRNTHSGSPQR